MCDQGCAKDAVLMLVGHIKIDHKGNGWCVVAPAVFISGS
jgi:hypothetical protein